MRVIDSNKILNYLNCKIHLIVKTKNPFLKRRKMISVNDIPILTLAADNIENKWLELIENIKTSTFIAIDIVNRINL